MRILGIETSCDETAAAVVEDGTHVVSNVIASAKDAFLWSGGVIPEEAARKQVECLLPVITQALSQAHITPGDLDAIAVTKGPGLLGSLIVGTVTARVLATVWQKPLIGIHHHLGHLSSTWLQPGPQSPGPSPQFPILTLTVSGGHTELWLRTAHTSGALLGRTRDDAAGEAFDKGACLLSLPYPGGPAIAKTAEGGNPHAFDFPLPLKGEDNFDFSFSGIKTALKYLLRDLAVSYKLEDIAASYQHAICHHLCDRTMKAIAQFPQVKEVHLVGGVSANTYLRTMLGKSIHGKPVVRDPERVTSQPVTVRWPVAITYCTDNAAMIAAAAEFLVMERGWPNVRFTTDASLPLTEIVKNR